MREQLIKALLAHAQGDIAKHKANIEVYLANPVGIGEHSNIVEAIEGELDMIAKYQDQIDIINKYFKNKDNREHLIIELGDVMWYVMQACKALHVTLDEVIECNVDKLKKRYPGGDFDVHYSENRKEGDR